MESENNSPVEPTPTSKAMIISVRTLAAAMVVIVALMLIAGLLNYGTFMGAIISMAGTLGLIWSILGGALMYHMRDKVRAIVASLTYDPKMIFVAFATTLALLEEVVTTTFSNFSYIFGDGRAFITASHNYLEVVIFHSVIVFVPMFFVWAWLLTRYRFSPAAVFLLFGINGVIAEAIIGDGTSAFIAAPFWIFVYGLMVFLPAYSFSYTRFPQASIPRWYHYPLAILLCLTAAAFMSIIVGLSAPHLPHFGSTLILPELID